MLIVAFNCLSAKGRDMKANIGTADRVIRIAAGMLMLSAIFLLDGKARWQSHW